MILSFLIAMLATWIHCIDPTPIRGQAGMSWSQFVKLHWDVLAASCVFEAQLSMVAQLWIVMTRLGRNPGVRGAQLPGLSRHGALSVRALVAQQACALGSGCLTYVATRRRRMPQEVFPTWRPVSSPPAALQEQTGSPHWYGS
jgi:hypothetical protein